MPVAKKPAAKKVAASKVVKKVKPASKTTPVAKKVAKKSNAKPASKTAIKKKVAIKAPAASTPVKEKGAPKGNDEYGLRVGTDLSIAAAEIVKGGKSRVDVIERLTNMLDGTTRTGRPKAVASVLAQAAKRLENQGYEEESSWRMVPGPDKSTTVKTKLRKASKTKPVGKVLKRKG